MNRVAVLDVVIIVFKQCLKGLLWKEHGEGNRLVLIVVNIRIFGTCMALTSKASARFGSFEKWLFDHFA